MEATISLSQTAAFNLPTAEAFAETATFAATPAFPSIDTEAVAPPAKKRKTRPQCWYWEHGCCHKGRGCGFAHMGPPGSKGVLDLQSAGEPCWFFLRGCCTKGLSCPFPHSGGGGATFAELLMQQQPVNLHNLWGTRDPAAFHVGEEQMKVPSKMAKALIGPGGENVKLLQQVTGCKVILDLSTQSADGLHTVKISGIPVQRAQAKSLIEQQCEAEQKAKLLKYEPNEPASDNLFTAVKVALSSAGADGQEEPFEIARIRAKITQFARNSSEEVDVSGQTDTLDTIIKQLGKNFFSNVCQTYYEKAWLTALDFQLVLEAAVRELIPESILSSTAAEDLDRLIWESHDFSFEEQRFLPFMWDIVRPLVDGPKMKKKAYKAIEVGRTQALAGGDEGSGFGLAEAFVRNWLTGTLTQLAEEGGGDPRALLEKEKVIEIFSALLAVPDIHGASAALPARWAAEAGIPEGGWQALLESSFEEACTGIASLEEEKKAEAQAVRETLKGNKGGKILGGKAHGKGKAYGTPRAYDDDYASPGPPVPAPAPSYMKGSSKGFSKGVSKGGSKGGSKGDEEDYEPPSYGKGKSTSKGKSKEVFPEESQPPGPSSAFVRRRGGYGQA
eukprot:TRINITY_DN19167_c0_g1_i1.p1 TRINITY_DN19167_c0_g1~~TRINITY_DN19167_c0_g1_i1.p1  ORF type:complete len:659 (-),score=164.92 TRINITY_DN19167_c0_g1_i1:69-1913(-)